MQLCSRTFKSSLKSVTLFYIFLKSCAMNFKLLLIAISAVSLASCSTTYKSGQTPDDVYYSPARSIDGSRYTKNDEPRVTDYEEREIRMSTYDYRWRTLGEQYNYDYSYSPYRYGYDYGYYYNPYYYPCPVYISGVAIRNPINTTPRIANLRAYGTGITVTNQKTYGTYQVNSRKAYSNSNSSSNTNSFIRKVINSARTSNSYETNNRNDNNNRTYTPSSNNSSSGSSGSSSGSISRPSRGRNN
jgi:hypothetical protein